MNPETSLCPICRNILYQRKCGLTCKNHQCLFYWKGNGWCLKGSLWVYSDNGIDKIIRWDKAHPGYSYPPIKKGVDKRHLAGMNAALQKDENLCFVIPKKYCLPGSAEAVL